MKDIYNRALGVILVLGLATLSVWANLASNMKFGFGWATLAVLTWIFWSWELKSDK